MLRGFVPERHHVLSVRCEHVFRGRRRDLMHGVPEWRDGTRGLDLLLGVLMLCG